MSKKLKTTHTGSGLPFLPEEILCLIAEDLDDHDIAACELVTPLWNEAFGRPLLVRDRIAQGFPGLLYHVDNQNVSDHEMRMLYREARRLRACRRRGRFGASMAEYPLRNGETNFTSVVLPPTQRAVAYRYDRLKSKSIIVPCIPRTRTTQFHNGCVAWRCSDQFTIIDHLDTMRREVIEWPGHEELAAWNKENYNPNYTYEVKLVGFSEDLLVIYDERKLQEYPHGRMVVYHREIKEWRTVKLPESWLSHKARFYTSKTTVIFLSTVREGEVPSRPRPRCGTGRYTRGEEPPLRKTLHRWSWLDEEGFQPIESAELPPRTPSTPSGQVRSGVHARIGAVFHPAAPAIYFAVKAGPSRVVSATAIKYSDGIPAGTTIEYTAELFPTERDGEFQCITKYPFGPCNDQGEHVVAMIYFKQSTGYPPRYFGPARVFIGTIYFNTITERFSCAKTSAPQAIWPSVPSGYFNVDIPPFVWDGILHYTTPLEQSDFKSTIDQSHLIDSFVRFTDAGHEESMDESTSAGGGLLPVPSPEQWGADTQLSSRMLGNDRYLVLLHSEGYVVWCFDRQHDVPGSIWQSWREQQSLVAEVTNRVAGR